MIVLGVYFLGTIVGVTGLVYPQLNAGLYTTGIISNGI